MADTNIASSPDGGELLQHARDTAAQSEAVSDQVEKTTWAVIRGLFPWLDFIPAQEVARLIEMRSPANDNDSQKEAA